MLSKGNDGRNQGEIIYIEDLVPKDHLLRKIDAAADFFIFILISHIYSESSIISLTEIFPIFRE